MADSDFRLTKGGGMLASVYIKDGNIHFYNEKDSFSDLGGLAYELGRPLLDFVCYEPERFEDSFSMVVEAYDDDYAYMVAREPDFISELRQMMSEVQKHEVYIFFYAQTLAKFVLAFADSPRTAIERLEKQIPGAAEKLAWAAGFEWPTASQGKIFADKERLLFKAAKDAAAHMAWHLSGFQKLAVHEIEVLLHYRKEIEVPADRPLDYIDIMDTYHKEMFGVNYYLERRFATFYGRVASGQVEQLYGIESIEDLFRFEFVKMAERDIFIKRCKNCGRFFIPKRRADAEYCDRIFGDTGRRCSEVGATLRYERKVAENPVLDAHKRAYRRLNSRTRAKKMSQGDFMKWSEEAAKKRDECLAGELPFDEFVAWLEQGRVRKSKSKPAQSDNDG
jgi:hypothetical protein